MHTHRRRSLVRTRPLLPLIAALCLLLLTPLRAHAVLQPDQIVLIVNKNVVEGVKLAKYYAARRGVPEKQILELSLPGTDEIAFEQYESEVVPAVRQFLKSNGLQQKIKCLLTFYGMPLKLRDRVDSPELTAERKKLEAELLHLRFQVEPIVLELEKSASAADPSFTPARGVSSIDGLSHRADAAITALNKGLAQISDPHAKADAINTINRAYERLAGRASLADQFARLQLSDLRQTPADVAKWTAVLQEVEKAKDAVQKLKERRYDLASRESLRKLIHDDFGLLEYGRLIAAQSEYLNIRVTQSALDSELSMLWADYYTSFNYHPNLLRYDVHVQGGPPMLMVMRLDAPDPGIVNNIILASLKVEQEGLKGRVVVDSRGLNPADPKDVGYAPFDESLRTLARFVKDKTHLPLVADDKPDVIRRPPESKIKDVAVYCGWYAVGAYTPSFQFKLGAVGYHVASFELTTLHTPNSGWVTGLLNDGVASTLGPVYEPYLQAFPPPDEFFPLLFTGKLTMAEVYWKTVPWTSWMISIIGDPLYIPFKQNPAIRPEDLPLKMRSIFQSPAAPAIPAASPAPPAATAPTTAPAAAPIQFPAPDSSTPSR
jgi:uncharacterized protein (TIGR03790 family)